MSRFRGPKGKLVRRFGVNIFGNPKFDRLLGKRAQAKGRGTKRRTKVSEYGLQLIEKQKLKYTYGLREREFRGVFKRAQKGTDITGNSLMILLESRLDNAIYRMAMAPTRDAARQMVLHGHLKVNGRRVNIPSYALQAGDMITVKDSAKSQALVRRYIEENSNREISGWVAVDKDNLKAQFVRTPLREEIPSVANEQLVVELYSK